MQARELSRELRESEDQSIRLRRLATGLGLTAAGSMGLISLYQMGIILHLPEPPLGLNADEVDASDEANEHFSTPDGVIGLRSYATTVALAASGGANRAEERPRLPLSLAAKVGFDAFQAARLTEAVTAAKSWWRSSHA